MSNTLAQHYDAGTLQASRIPFQHTPVGFLICAVDFPRLDGLWYIRQLLMCPGVEITCSQLRARASSMDETEAFENNLSISAHDSYLPTMTLTNIKILDGALQEMEATLPTITNPFEFQEQHSKATSLRKMLAREVVKDKDGNYIRSRQVNKRLKNDSDTVRKSVNSAVCRLIETPETQAIGFYLRDTIKTGTRCKFTGKQKWKFS